VSGLLRAAVAAAGPASFEGTDHGAGISFFLVDSAPGRGPRLHRHPYEEVFIVREGRATFRLGDDAVEAEPGDVVVAPAGTPHGFTNSGSGQLRLVAVHESPEFVTEWLEPEELG